MPARLSRQRLRRSCAVSSAYARWRAGALGRITDAIERGLLFDLVGEVGGQRILDVGCGDGDLASHLAQVGGQVVGVDVDVAAVDAARARFAAASQAGAFLNADAAALPFPDGAFDIVIAVTSLCFVNDTDETLAEMARVLKPGGRLVIGELNALSPWAIWRRMRGWLGHARWRAAHFWRPRELKQACVNAGLRVEAMRTAIFYPPIGWMANALKSFDGCLSRRLISGGAFLAVACTREALGPTTISKPDGI